MFPASSPITFACFWWTSYKNTAPDQIRNSVKDIWQSHSRHSAVKHKEIITSKTELWCEWAGCRDGLSPGSKVFKWLLPPDQDNFHKSAWKRWGSWKGQEWWEERASLPAVEDVGPLVWDPRQRRLTVTRTMGCCVGLTVQNISLCVLSLEEEEAKRLWAIRVRLWARIN